MPFGTAQKIGRQQRIDTLLSVGTYNTPSVRLLLQDGDAFAPVSSIFALPSSANDCSLHPSGLLQGYAHFFNPFFSFVSRNGGQLSTVSKSGSHTIPTDHADACSFSGTGEYFAVGSRTGQRLHVYKISQPEPTVVTISDVPVSGELPPGTVFDLCFSADDSYLLVASNPVDGQQGAGRLRVYKKQAGDAYSFLTSLPLGNSGFSGCCCFDSTSTYLVTGGNPTSGNQVYFYKRTGDSFSLLLSAEPAVVNRSTFSCSFTKDGQYVAIGFGIGNTGSFSGDSFVWYKRSGDTFSKMTTPAHNFSNQSRVFDLAWSADGTYLAAAQVFDGSKSANGLTIFKRSGDTLTALPNTSINTEVSGVAFYPGAVPGSV